MGFKLTIKTGNAAFCDEQTGEEAPNHEVARLLREAADEIENGADGGVLVDINGNNVGRYSL